MSVEAHSLSLCVAQREIRVRRIRILTLTVLLVILMSQFSANMILRVKAFNFGACRWNVSIPYSMALFYYNGVSSIGAEVDMAAQAWYDMPIPFLIVRASSQSYANVIVREDTSNTGDGPGSSDVACSSGFIQSPVTITIFDTFYCVPGTGQTCHLLQLPFDEIVGAVAHEFGHALGLAHSDDAQSLMFGPTAADPNRPSNGPYNAYHIFVPVFDDINAVTRLYGWTQDTDFTLTSTTGSASASGTVAPITLQVFTPASGTSARAFTSKPLPGSLSPNIAIMMGFVFTNTLYRFNIGWSRSSGVFAMLELDNDGVKLISPWSIQTAYSGPNLRAGFSYFLELVVMQTIDQVVYGVKATAFAFLTAGRTTNSGTETILGSRDSGTIYNPSNCPNPPNNCEYLRWNDANSFQSSVWTDSSANPASNYRLDDFWNIQGDYCTKFGCGGGGAGSLAHGTLITMVNGSQIPVQHLVAGDRMLGYNTTTGQFGVSTVKSITVVSATTQLIIHTEAGMPLRVDASPTEVLWTWLGNGTMTWLPVTLLHPGDFLLTQSGWVKVTRFQIASGGTHMMYDVAATGPYFANGYLDPPLPS